MYLSRARPEDELWKPAPEQFRVQRGPRLGLHTLQYGVLGRCLRGRLRPRAAGSRREEQSVGYHACDQTRGDVGVMHTGGERHRRRIRCKVGGRQHDGRGGRFRVGGKKAEVPEAAVFVQRSNRDGDPLERRAKTHAERNIRLHNEELSLLPREQAGLAELHST